MPKTKRSRHGKKKHRHHAKKPTANPGPRRNPPVATDIIEFILPGFGAFAATKFGTRMAAVTIAKRAPKYARHAGVAAALATFGAAWFGAHRIKALEKYHTPIVVGSGLALLQTLVQTYIPALGWLVVDVPAAELQGATATQGALGDGGVLPADPSWYTTNDSYDNGRWREVLPGEMETVLPPKHRTNVPTPQAAAQVDDLMADLEADAMKSWSFNGAEN